MTLKFKMEDKIIKILEISRQIKPEQDFQKRSRALILGLPKPKNPVFRFSIFKSFQFAASIGFAAILIFIIAGGFTYFISNVSPALLAGFDEATLMEEAAGLDFKIQLGEAKYFDDSAEQIAALLEELSKAEKEGADLDSGKIILNSVVL